MNDKFLPWEDDELEFVPGNWEIERADVPGLYNYSVGGVRAAVAVDGIQLIEWHMAKLVEYTLLKPWDDSDITFVGESDIMRDILDKSDPVGERGYVVSSGKKLMRVNKYWLVKNGMASGSKAFDAKVAQKSIKSGKYNKDCKPWVTDDIFIATLPDNVKIERAASEGRYLMKIGGTIVTCSADRLIEKGYALKGYDVKIEALCADDKTSINEYADGTHGFWMYEHVKSVKTLRDIARLWADLEKGYEGKLAKRIISHNRNIAVACAGQRSELDDIADILDKTEQDLSKAENLLNQLDNDIVPLKRFETATITDNCGAYSALRSAFQTTYILIGDILGSSHIKLFDNVRNAIAAARGKNNTKQDMIDSIGIEEQAVKLMTFEFQELLKKMYPVAFECMKSNGSNILWGIEHNFDAPLTGYLLGQFFKKGSIKAAVFLTCVEDWRVCSGGLCPAEWKNKLHEHVISNPDIYEYLKKIDFDDVVKSLSVCADDVFPIEILPENLYELLKDEYQKIKSVDTDYNGKLNGLDNRYEKCKATFYYITGKHTDAYKEFCAIDGHMEELEKRKQTLDRVAENLGPERHKRRGLFGLKKDKASHIKFLTRVKIEVLGGGQFSIADKYGPITLTAAELVYMKLAEYYY